MLHASLLVTTKLVKPLKPSCPLISYRYFVLVTLCTLYYLNFALWFKYTSAVKYTAKKMSCKPIFRCKFCLLTLRSYYLLHKHKLEHLNSDKPYKCQQCEEEFSNVVEYTAHIRIHKEQAAATVKNTAQKTSYKPIFRCNVCLLILPSYYLLRKHKLRHLKSDKPYKCQQCEEEFSNVVEYAAHIRIHKGKHPYTCKKCDEGFLKKMKQPKKKYRCDVCAKQFSTPGNLDRHKLVHTGLCNKCNKGSQQSSNLSKHQLILQGMKPFLCDICNKQFRQFDILERHILTHSVEKPVKCQHCPKDFIRDSQLAIHIEKHHSNVDKNIEHGKHPYTCKKCGEGFWKKTALEAHMPVHILKKMKQPEKKFRCDVCSKEFSKLCDVERHTRVHTGEKPCVCNICNKRFQQSNNLGKHLLIHLDIKPFHCEICNKQFRRIDILERHVLIHSVEKPAKCQHCPKSFIRHSQLAVHIKKHHPNGTKNIKQERNSAN